jgi:hypothetical protein
MVRFPRPPALKETSLPDPSWRQHPDWQDTAQAARKLSRYGISLSGADNHVEYSRPA